MASGSSTPGPAISSLLQSYATNLKSQLHSDSVPINQYNSTTSHLGLQDLLNWNSAFVGIDDYNLSVYHMPLQSAVPLPFVRATVSIGYNLGDCQFSSPSQKLVLDTTTLGLIFNGTITSWNDSRIAQYVTWSAPCNLPIKTLCVANYSGVTATFVRAINSTANIYLGDTKTHNPSALAKPCFQSDVSVDNLLFLIQLNRGSIGYIPTSTRSQAFTVTYASIYSPVAHASVTTDNAVNTAAWIDSLSPSELALPSFTFNACPSCWPFLLTTYVVILESYHEQRAASYFDYWKSPFLNESNAASCLNLHYSALFLQQSTASSSAPPYYLPLSPAEKRIAETKLATVSCIVEGENFPVLATNFLGLYTWSAAGLMAVLSGLGTLAGTLSIGLLIFGYNESLYKRDLRVLAAMSGEANFGMGPSTALLEQLYSDERSVQLEERHSISAPMEAADEQQEPLLDSNASSLETPAMATPSSGLDPLPPRPAFQSLDKPRTDAETSMTAHTRKEISSLANAARSSTIISKALVPVSELNIGGLIGSGSYGDVFKGKLHGTVVAVKRIPVTQDEELVQGFVKEVKAMVRLDHPHILQMLAISIQHPYAYIVTEYCANGAIDKYLQAHPAEIDVMRKLEWMKQIAEAMVYLHAQQVIHRDLKLSNILLTTGLLVRVGDLGTAALGQQSGRTRVGTLNHCAPEILDGKPYDQSCDVYSFGICLWCLFSSVPLYHGYTMYDIITRVTSGQRPPLDPIPSQKLSSIIQACWAQEPSQRPTFEVVVQALSQLKDSDFETFT